MDCDVNLQQFANEAFVIERPADACLLADNACEFLAKKGMKILFGSAAAEARDLDAMVTKTVPKSVGVISRSKGSVISAGGPVVAAWPPKPSKDEQTAASRFLTGFEMLGRSYCAGSDVTSVSFALSSGMDAGLSAEDLRAFVETQAISLKYSDNELNHSTTSTSASVTFGSKDAGALEEFDAFLAAYGSKDDGNKERRQTFNAKSFGSQTLGPSYLDHTRFNFKTLKEIQGVHPDLLKVVDRAREISSVAFEVVPDTGGMRDAAEQRRLKKSGKSKAKLGRHTIGHAIDLVPVNAKGQPDFSDEKGFELIREAMELAANELGIPIQWGGNWRKLVDKPHYELDRKAYPGPDESPAPEEILTAFR